MGIPEFWGQHIKNSPGIDIKNLPSEYIYSLAIDLPGIIHGAAQKVWIYGNHGLQESKVQEARAKLKKEDKSVLISRFYDMITNKIAELVEAYDPRLLIIALDGKAPMAKIQEQRKRRFKGRQLNQAEIANFDSVEISVGTDLMIGLHRYLDRWIIESQKPVTKTEIIRGEEKQVSRSLLPRRVIYSSYLSPGEAEHKIMEIYKSDDFYDLAYRDKDKGQYYNVLYGKDADLILLSLISPLNNIVIVRESYFDMVNIEGLRKYLDDEAINYDDYVIMLSFVGNDFIPRQPAFREVGAGIVKMVNVYKVLVADVRRSFEVEGQDIPDSIFSDENGIVWYYLSIFLERISENNELYQDMIQGHIRMEKSKRTREPIEGKHIYQSLLMDKSLTVKAGINYFNYQAFRKAWYDNAIKYRGELPFAIDNRETEEENRVIQEGDYVDDDIENMCNAYLVMFSWVYRYYKLGQADWGIYYPFHYAPLLGDIVNFLRPKDLEEEELDKHIEDLGESFNTLSGDPENESGRYHILQQLLCITPPSSKDILPKDIRKYLTYNSGIIDMYPSKVVIDRDGSKNESTFNCLVPFANMDRIAEETSSTIGKMEGNSWEENDDIFFYESEERATVKRSAWYYTIRRRKEGEERASRGTRGSRGRGRGTRGRGRESGESSEQPRSKSTGKTRPTGESMRGRGTRGSRGRGRATRGRGSKEAEKEAE